VREMITLKARTRMRCQGAATKKSRALFNQIGDDGGRGPSPFLSRLISNVSFSRCRQAENAGESSLLFLSRSLFFLKKKKKKKNLSPQKFIL